MENGLIVIWRVDDRRILKLVRRWFWTWKKAFETVSMYNLATECVWILNLDGVQPGDGVCLDPELGCMYCYLAHLGTCSYFRIQEHSRL